jgi:hypothetical protein
MLLEDERIAGALVVALVDVRNMIYKNVLRKYFSSVYFLTSTLDFFSAFLIPMRILADGLREFAIES